MDQLLAPPTVPQAIDSMPDNDSDEGATLERKIMMSARRSSRFIEIAEASNAGAETVEQLHHETTGLASAYVTQPLTAIMSDVVELQEAAFTLLEGRQKPKQTRDLYVLASLLTGMCAKASQDLGRFHEAMTLARTMYVCAENAGHLGLCAWARNLQSLVAYWSGRPEQAVRFAQSGQEAGSSVAGTVMAWLAASEARAFAQFGDARQARAALQRAGEYRDSVQQDDLDEVGGLFEFPVAKQHYYAAGTHVFLDADEDASREASDALSAYGAQAPQSRAFADEAGAHCELALARVHGGELDGTRDALSAVLDLPGPKRIGGIVTSVNRVHAALRSPAVADAPAARDLRMEIEVFTRGPAAAITE